jgi:hypothetical protein
MPTDTYQYSEPIVVKAWNGGRITVKVGYVENHPEKRDLVIEKTWAAPHGYPGHQKINIKDAEDWKKICETVNSLWPEIQTVISDSDIKQAIKKVAVETELLDLLSKYPEIISTLPKNVNLLTLPEDQKKALFTFFEAGREIAGKALSRLSTEPIEDIEQLINILDSYKLSTVNSLVTHVTSRLSFIETFEKIIHNDSSYERRGADSVHNLLKANIWLIDRNYTILQDDETLKKIILTNWSEVVTEDESSDRPDFLCMTEQTEDDDMLVLIEIKRPSVTLKFSMIEQIMRYRSVLTKYSGKTHRNFKAFLIGREIDALLQANPLRDSGIVVKTYTDFIGDARRFYKDYLTIVSKEQYAI